MKINKFTPNALSLLWLTAAIWGFAFVAQKAGMDYIGPFTFNGIRFALGTISLLPLAYFQKTPVLTDNKQLRNALPGGLLAGIILFAGASLQQHGIIWTTAGKAGFVTGLYVLLVPVIGLFIGLKTGRNLWIGSILAVAGLYFLTSPGRLSVGQGDLLVLASAIFWASHVQVINYQVKKIHPLILSIIQFATCSVLSLTAAFLFEEPQSGPVLDAVLPLLYGGLMSVGVAYTLQVFAQQHVNPAYASIILSFETVFAVIGGWMILGETMTRMNILGCLMMLSGMIVAQLKPFSRHKQDDIHSATPE